jgi:hypothetical protein
MAVSFKAVGTFTAGTTSITPPYPTLGNAPVANDIAILVCESENQAISLTTANGFVEMGAQANKATGTGGVTGATRLAVYWKRCVGSDSAPVVADSGDHTTGQIFLFSGVRQSGNPWDVFAESFEATSDTTGSIPSTTTTVANTMIMAICTTSNNANSTAEFTGWANANLSGLAEVSGADNSNTAGLGGGFGVATGTWASIGDYGATTVTLANASSKGLMSIALAPDLPPTVTTSSPANGATVTDTTPDLTFSGTDPEGSTIEYQVNVYDPTSSTILDSYVEANQSVGGYILSFINFSAVGQAFQPSADRLINKSVFYLKISAGTPTGTLVSKIYATTGTLGNSCVPTVRALATSDNVDISVITSSFSLVTFSFSSPVILTSGVNYAVTVEVNTGTVDGSNNLIFGIDGTSPTHAGNLVDFSVGAGSWLSSAIEDAIFYVYYTPVSIDKISSTDTGFINQTNGGNTHPFTSGNTIVYTVQSALALGTYFWRIRGKDPTGSNTFGAWSSLSNFILAAPVTFIFPPHQIQPILAQ